MNENFRERTDSCFVGRESTFAFFLFVILAVGVTVAMDYYFEEDCKYTFGVKDPRYDSFDGLNCSLLLLLTVPLAACCGCFSWCYVCTGSFFPARRVEEPQELTDTDVELGTAYQA